MTPIDWLIMIGGSVAAIWMACGVWTAIAATQRGGRPIQWAVIGLFLGPLGPFVVLKVLSRQCPSCQAHVMRTLLVCPACGKDVPRLAENPDGPLWTYRRNW